MRQTVVALRITLVTLAGALAAACAHLVIDIAGDYLLARDAYDGIAHHSRALLLAAVGVCALFFVARILFDALDRRCTSTTSLLALVRNALGSPVRFAAETALAAIVLLAAMEYFDLATIGARVDDIGDLFGGSLALGLTATIACGALAGSIVRRLLRALSDYEPALAQLVSALLRVERRAAPTALHARRLAVTPLSRQHWLGARGRKRGPPQLTPA